MEEHTETWHLRSGTWRRNAQSESWRLAATPNGTLVHAKLPDEDLGRMIRANRDSSNGHWLPADFNYSPRTGAPLQVTIASLDSPWVPPFGAPALADLARPLSRGLRQTASPLYLVRSSGPLEPASEPDSTLSPLPPGRYRFLVHKFDVASPVLMAIEPQQGNLQVLLPESKSWVALQDAAGGMLPEGLKNSRGWRMEAVKASSGVTLYFPTVRGLAAVTPRLIGLSFTVEYFGRGVALGSPVAWAGAVWVPVLGRLGVVNLVGKPPGAAEPIVMRTSALAPKNGFEAPVFDSLHVVWPSDEGQLVVRLGQDGKKKTEWIAWPDGLSPTFSLGCPYVSSFGFLWQPCWKGESIEYVEMGKPAPERIAVDGPRFSTGHVSYRRAHRIVGDPWKETGQVVDAASSEIVVPLLESEIERAVISLRLDAPQGIAALLESAERQRAVLQVQAESRVDVQFGTLTVARPWLATVFIHDAHLWVYHPELPQALGWKLFH